MSGDSTTLRWRRRYDVDFKRRIVRKANAPGASVAAVARRCGLNANMVFIWRGDPGFAPHAAEPAFLPVELGASSASIPTDHVEAATVSDGEIVVRLDCGAEVMCRCAAGS